MTPSAKTVNGPVHAVPCPWCGKPNDCRRLAKALETSFEKGTHWECDHCHNLVMIVRVTQVTVVQVRQHGEQVAPIPNVTK
jgi:hypothetical protein